MRSSALLCIVIGHRWVQPPDVHEAYPLFECKRCGHRAEFAQGSRSAGFDTRLDARTRADRSLRGGR